MEITFNVNDEAFARIFNFPFTNTPIPQIENKRVYKKTVEKKSVKEAKANKKFEYTAPKAGKYYRSPYKFNNCGEHSRKLSEANVIDIKRELMNGVQAKAIALQYHVTQKAILDIKYGKNYRYIRVHGWDEWLLEKGYTKYMINRM